MELRAVLEKGDLEAGRALVSKLAAEAEFGRILTEEADLATLETEEDIDIFPEVEDSARTGIDKLTEIGLAGKMAAARYYYAAQRWREIEKTLL